MEADNNVAIAGSCNNGGGLTNGTITGGLVAPVPNVCPGCGRCRDCGHPYPNSTPYQSPFWPPYSQPTITYGPNTGIVQTGTVAINATNSAQS